MTWPTFLIIGAAKAGTTSLYQYLQQHPAVYVSLRKEPNFFAFDGESTAGRGEGFCRMVRNAVVLAERYQALFAAASTETALGEASPKYLYHTRSAERIRHYRPDMKLIAILRQPVDRAYSQYRDNLKGGGEIAHSFEKAVAWEPQRIAADWQDKHHYLNKGYYGQQIQHYQALFAPEQLRVYLYEDLVSAPARLMADIAAFLEIDATFTFDTSVRHNASSGVRVPAYYPAFRLWAWLERLDRGKARGGRLAPPALRPRVQQMLLRSSWTPPLKPAFRHELTERYREDISLLSELIQRDLSHWLA